MMRHLMCLALCTLAHAYKNLSFRADGTFKILQVADMHFGNGHIDECIDVSHDVAKYCDGAFSTAFLIRVIDQEQPDFVVFTGDQIDSQAHHATTALDAVLDPVISSKTPWSAILGNHDGDNDMTRKEVFEYMARQPFTMMPATMGDYVLEIVGNGTVTPLWFFDSGSRFENDTYEWIKPLQLAWFTKASADVRRIAHMINMTVNPGLAFWHIPTPEFAHVENITAGTKNEGVSASKVNSGLYGALLLNGVRAGFVGHDHTNDYCALHFGHVHLCYGGGSGYHTYGKAGWARRMRVIKLLDQGRKGATWVHLDAKVDEAVESFIPLFTDTSDYVFDESVQLVSLARRQTALFVFVSVLVRTAYYFLVTVE